MMTERRKDRRILSAVLVFTMLLTLFGSMPVPVRAIAAETLTMQVMGKDGKTPAWEETWYFKAGTSENGWMDADLTKNADGTGESLSIVRNFTDYEGFEEIGALAYCGYRYGGGFPCIAVCKRGILLEDLIDYAETQSGYGNLRGDAAIQMEDPTGWVLPYSENPQEDGKYSEFIWGNAEKRYYYPGLYEHSARFDMSAGAEYISAANAVEVPTVLSMVGYYHNNAGGSLKDCLERADTDRSLRLFFGTSTTESDRLDENADIAGNMGNYSGFNIQRVTFYPVYEKISVTGGQLQGEEGSAGCAYKISHAAVTSGDNYFSASAGETVTLTVTPDSGYVISSLTVNGPGSGVKISRRGDVFTFVMPEGGAEVNVTAESLSGLDSHTVTLEETQETQGIFGITASSEGGTAASVGFPGSASENQTVTVTVTRSGDAATSCIGGLAVSGNGGPCEVREVSAEKDEAGRTVKAVYCFTMPSYDVTCSVTGVYDTLTVSESTVGRDSSEKKSYARDEIAALDEEGTYYYGGFDAEPAVLEGSGVLSVGLKELLTDAGVEFLPGDEITFTCADGSGRTFTYDELYGEVRYYFPYLYTGESWSAKSNSKTECLPHIILSGALEKSADLEEAGSSIDEIPADSVYAYRLGFGMTMDEFSSNPDASPSAESLTADGYLTHITEISVDHALNYDISWYTGHENDEEYTISTESQLRGLAELVNGTALTGGTDPDYGDISGKETFGGDTAYEPVPAVDFAGKTVRLSADVRLAGSWTPIGDAQHSFAGIFDGGTNSITGLSVSDAAGGYQGLFGNNSGTVKNFFLSGSIGTEEKPITSGSDNIGGAAGYNGGTVSCVTGNVTIYVDSDQIYAVGGIVGQNGDGALITECGNYADITGTKAAGGIAGRSYGDISSSFNTGNITGNGGGKDGIGGIVGIAGNKNSTYANSVVSCWNSGTIRNDGGRWHGGIAGMADSASTVENCLSLGQIEEGYSWNWNPVIGHVDGVYDTVRNNYSLEGLSAGDTETATIPLTTGIVVTAEEMRQSGFADLLGADYQTNDGCFPVLRWQTASGHQWDAGVTQPPTSSKDGLTTYTCLLCGMLREIILPATGSGSGGSGGSGSVDTSGLDLRSSSWDGFSVDVSWYIGHENRTSYTIDTAAKLAGAAAVANGLVNSNCRVYTGSRVLSASEWNDSNYVLNATGTHGACNRATDDYSYGVENFEGKTLYLTSDLDMSAGNYMSVGGQYLMDDEDVNTKIGSSFCGTFDGGGHNVTIVCDRHCTLNYGDGSSVGLIGRLGVHDNDPEEWRPKNPAVRDVAVYGSVRGNRSVGGIVGKIGKTQANNSGDSADGAVIENCANFASVSGTDAKGTGGIAGAAWNGGVIRNCYNSGEVHNTHNSYGGIAGSNEISLINCYNAGTVTGAGTSAAIATDSGGSYTNCYWLNISADTGVYNIDTDGVQSRTSTEMKSEEFLNALGSAFAQDTGNLNNGYPVLTWQNPGAPAGTGSGGSTGDAAEDGTGEETTDPENTGEEETDIPSGTAGNFTDIPAGAWYEPAVNYVVSNGYFNGVSSTEFDPQGTMTRAMFSTAVGRLAGVDESAYAGSSFADVPEGKWYSAYVKWASDSGIVNGVGDGTFDPDGEVTREQMAALLYRYAQYAGIDVTPASGAAETFASFSDSASVSGYAREAMIWAVGAGIISGSDGRLLPQDDATRAQVAQIVMNYAGLSE